MAQNRNYVEKARNLKVHRLTMHVKYRGDKKVITESHKPLSLKEAESMVENYKTRKDVFLNKHHISYIY